MFSFLKSLFIGSHSYSSIVPLESKKIIKNTFRLGTIFGLIGLTGYPLAVEEAGFRLVFLGLLISLATLTGGFFTGCLFGMPKRNPDENSNYELNNSLVEISDWLTKIIVGLGLVNLMKIPGYLSSIGQYVSSASGIESKGVDVYTICLVLFFGVLGLYLGYNYMRLVLSRLYKESDDKMLQKELEEKTEVNKSLLHYINQSDQPIEELQENMIRDVTTNQENVDRTSIEKKINRMVKIAEARTLKGLLRKNNDPQKGMWGGKSINNNRQIQATVSDRTLGLFHITLRVSSTDPVNSPFEDGEVVLFALHDSFGDPPIRLSKIDNGIAELTLISYGSFTVGALTDEGKTELELDLAEIQGVSEYFKNH